KTEHVAPESSKYVSSRLPLSQHCSWFTSSPFEIACTCFAPVNLSYACFASSRLFIFLHWNTLCPLSPHPKHRITAFSVLILLLDSLKLSRSKFLFFPRKFQFFVSRNSAFP